jgi:polyisoprenoid-binding protein YceI
VQTVLTTSSTLENELRGDKWFDVAHFPTATFTSAKVTPIGKGTATITGDLTLHGVTRPVTLKARFSGAGVNPLDKAYTTVFLGDWHHQIQTFRKNNVHAADRR